MPRQKKENAARLPPISAALVLSATYFELIRDSSNSHEWCSAVHIGKMRKMLGHTTEKPLRFDDIAIARDQARVLLAETCRVCPFKKCPMKRW